MFFCMKTMISFNWGFKWRTTTQGNLICHILSVHEGAIYECSQCYYETTWKDNLTRYVKSTHYGVECGCNYFDFRPSYKSTRINGMYLCVYVKPVLNGKDLYIYVLKSIF